VAFKRLLKEKEDSFDKLYVFGSFLSNPDQANDIDFVFDGTYEDFKEHRDELEGISIVQQKPIEVFISPQSEWVGKWRFFPHNLVDENVTKLLKEKEDSFGGSIEKEKTDKGIWFTDTVFTGSGFFDGAKQWNELREKDSP
jgi:hypothetical protein